MTKEEQREKVIEGIADLLRCSSFSFEYRVKKKPEGIKIISEVTQEQLNAIMAKAREKQQEKQENYGKEE
jgi:hypothetical protein